jgi:hypothetical protein
VSGPAEAGSALVALALGELCSDLFTVGAALDRGGQAGGDPAEPGNEPQAQRGDVELGDVVLDLNRPGVSGDSIF